MTEQYNIQYTSKRCLSCGTYWAIETWRNYANSTCPFCASDSIRLANDRAAAAERSRNSLKGALTRMRRGK